MKIAIIGTGANGSCVAADLAEAGMDITLIDQWPDHVSRMRENGLIIQMPNKKLHINVNAHNLCDVCTFKNKFDLIFIVVKAYDTQWICKLIEPYLADDGIAVGLQNGMTAQIIEDIFGEDRNLAAVVELSSEIFIPGEVKRNTPPEKTWFGIGSLSNKTNNRIDEVLHILSHSGKVTNNDNILSAKWMKLIVNAMTMGPRSILGLKVIEAMECEGMRNLALNLGQEALSIGQKLGYEPEPIFGLTSQDIQGSNRLLELLLDKIIKDVGPHARDAVLQDHLKGRHSEVDLINGLIVEEGKKLGMDYSYNQKVVEITQKIKDGIIKPKPENIGELIS
tara:strand:- start:8555 stop:9562 length:1008 start_codon:yes stop_codon:yes gene_type:complete